MGVTNSNRVLSSDRMDCDGSLRVTLALTAAPDLVSNPTDIVLLLDRSSSMSGVPLASMKDGAKSFIDILAEATGGAPDGQIGAGSRIGIVSFSDFALVNASLSTDVALLKSAVDALVTGGATNHADAFLKGMELFDPASQNAQVMVMFTDGNTTAGPLPAPVADAARARGIVIYCIGLVGSDGLDIRRLNNWATDPDATHVAVTPNPEDLENLFAQLAANISKPGATNIEVLEAVQPDFVITGIATPGKGSVEQLDDRNLKWSIAQLGVTGGESATLEFFIRHTGRDSGTKKVNRSIVYSDTEGNQVTFPDPSVTMECRTVITPEPCPVPLELSIAGCDEQVMADLGSMDMGAQGTILQLNTTLRQVCPGKRVALAALLTEVDCRGCEHSRGMKTMTIPAHQQSGCRDVLVRCIRFVIPADLNVSGCGSCGERRFRVRFLANYVDGGACNCPPVQQL